MDCRTPGSSVLHYLPEFAQIHVHWVGDAIQPSHPLLPPSPLAFNLSQHWGLFQWVGSLENTLESPLGFKEIKPVNLKGNQSWICTIRTDAEAEAPIIWPSDSKSWLIGKDADVGKGWRQEEEEATQEEIVGWYHQLNGHEFEQTPGDSGGQRSLVCYGPLGRKESDTT